MSITSPAGSGFVSSERLADALANRRRLLESSNRAVAGETGLTPEQVAAYTSGQSNDPSVAAAMKAWNRTGDNSGSLGNLASHVGGTVTNTAQGLGDAASGKHGFIPQAALAAMAYFAAPSVMGSFGGDAAASSTPYVSATEGGPMLNSSWDLLGKGAGETTEPFVTGVTGTNSGMTGAQVAGTSGKGSKGMFEGMNALDYMNLANAGVGLASALTGRPSSQTQTSYINDVSAPWEQGGARGDLARALMSRLGGGNDYWSQQAGMSAAGGLGSSSAILQALLDAKNHPRSAVSVYDPKYISANPLQPVQSGMDIVNGQTPGKKTGSLLSGLLNPVNRDPMMAARMQANLYGGL